MARALTSIIVMCGALAACTSEQAEKMLGEEFPQQGMYEVTSTDGDGGARTHINIANKADLREFLLKGQECEFGELSVGQGRFEGQGTCYSWDYPTALSGSYSSTSLDVNMSIDMGEAGLQELERQYHLVEPTPAS